MTSEELLKEFTERIYKQGELSVSVSDCCRLVREIFCKPKSQPDSKTYHIAQTALEEGKP